ncbi:aspartyl protease, putative [Perkinsus marinus ATCC 50983]|uniref:Aspartyl protease, putative n=1 Tax=Perkinsus marinus (strain ATCC 50983 / TXsc) TaxID=423536 RepID=C5LA90_PERM5|nr:aspartyl protease, putative [Perkinsus marinus ATCC 50983]EER06346.1 aspartyl protease, putative [Perkinsus marinus ATCC 50983]|eukprot:XP_002774530.1 aspartyl protease, putative [Perkinsus marinus ATCC 50983]
MRVSFLGPSGFDQAMTFYFARFLLLAVVHAELILRLPISLDVYDPGRPDLFLIADITVDAMSFRQLVDTGSPVTFFIWRKWYESVKPGGCETIPSKCYACLPECTPGPTEVFSFQDGTEVTLFKHSGAFSFGGKVVRNIDFGLMANFNFEYTFPPSLIGLGYPHKEPAPYEPLIKQLLDKPKAQRLIGKNMFSVYLDSAAKPTGELLLGGQDPTKYVGPMVFVPSAKDHWEVALIGMKVGANAEVKFGKPMSTEIDTGATGIFMSESYRNKLLKDLQSTATKPVKFQPYEDLFEINCADRQSLQPVTLFMRGAGGQSVPLEIPQEHYIRLYGRHCLLFFGLTDIDTWAIGNLVLPGRYLLFDYQENKIGFAKTK